MVETLDVPGAEVLFREDVATPAEEGAQPTLVLDAEPEADCVVELVEPPEGYDAKVIEGEGRWLMPGQIKR